MVSDQWFVGISCSIIATFLITIITDAVKKEKFSTTIINWSTSFLNFFLKLLNIEIRLWIILCIVMLFVVLRRIFIALNEGQVEFDYNKYTTDFIKGFKWNWRWEFNSYRNCLYIKNLTPECKKCNTELLTYEWKQCYQCPRCGALYPGLSSHTENIRAIIGDNVKRIQEQIEITNRKEAT